MKNERQLACAWQVAALLLATTAYAIVAIPLVAQVTSESDVESREAEIERLRQVIRDKQIQEQDPERVDKAIRRLGDLKAVEAVDDLIALLAFKHPKETRAGGALDGYRAKGALFQIGEPALPALVRAISSSDIGSMEFKNAREAVMGIFRDDLPAGARYLREQAKQADSAAAEARLWAAAQWIDDLHAKLKASEARQNPR